jgi:hypothetical protein
MTIDHSAHRRRHPAAAIDGVSMRLHEAAARAPAAFVLVLVALILALVFAPGVNAASVDSRQAMRMPPAQGCGGAGHVLAGPFSG